MSVKRSQTQAVEASPALEPEVRLIADGGAGEFRRYAAGIFVAALLVRLLHVV